MKLKIIPSFELVGVVDLPPDKSISHRAALFAAIAEGRSTISNYSDAADPQTTLKCLRQLGVSIQQKNEVVVIEGVGRSGLKTPAFDIDCGNSGTTMRLISGILGGAGVQSTLTGDESLSARTMKRIIDPLRLMNIEIKARDNNYAPLQIWRNEHIKPLYFELPIASAQLKSCVLLAGLFGDEPTTVIENTPSRDHTERLLQLPVEQKADKKIIYSDTSCEIPAQSYRIPGDFSAAAYWLAAASIHPKASVKLEGVGVNPTRTGALTVLQKMGANIMIKNERLEGAEPVADVQIQSSHLKAININPELIPNCIDELPILMVAMLFADGVSTIAGAGELRHKETDRISAMAQVLQVAGASFEEMEDGIIIHGHPDFTPRAGIFNSYDDHRIAMSAAILSLMADGASEILGAECTSISYPGFWDDMKELGI